MRKAGLFAAFIFVFSVGCQQGRNDSSSREPEREPAGEEASTYVEQANEAIRALQAGLVQALTSAMKEGGPPSAVHVCRDEAQTITQHVSQEKSILVGRTSHRLRNPKNAPRPWAEAVVRDAAEKKTGDVESHVIDLGDKVGVLKPINTMSLCTNCHGSPDEVGADVKQALAEAYPEDQAVGFAVGDLRGWMWAEVPKKGQ
jgi:hypothetical protein